MLMFENTVNILTIAIIYSIIGFNIYLTTNVMKMSDMTCDASVALGGCAYGTLILHGTGPEIAFALAMMLGVIAGLITAALSTHLDVDPVLSSIITMTAMQTFVVKICDMGKRHIEMNGEKVLTTLTPIDNLLLVICISAGVSVLFHRMLTSEYGLAMRVFGDGKIISESLGINRKAIMWVGLAIANGLSAAAGALVTTVTGDFSSSMGAGSLIFGLASTVIGAKIVPNSTIKGAIIGCFIGSILYKIAIEIVTIGGEQAIGAEYKNVLTALGLILLMISVKIQKKKSLANN